HHLPVREPADDAAPEADVEMATDGFGELGVRVAGEDSHPLKGHLPEPQGGRAKGQIDGVALSHRNSRRMATPRRPRGARRRDVLQRAKVTPALIHSLAMSAIASSRGLTLQDMEVILAVTSKLAAPFDLMTMLAEVVNAAKQVLHADRGSVWLYDSAADELVLEIATGIAPVRVPASAGIVGACARERRIINVPDCYKDARFNPDVDRASGYRTRCMLALPLIDHREVLVGVMQVLNKAGGEFNADDEILATALAAQCAVALQRVRMTAALIEGEKMR